MTGNPWRLERKDSNCKYGDPKNAAVESCGGYMGAADPGPSVYGYRDAN